MPDASGPARVHDGMRLFADHCAGCHQIAAQGGYLTGAVAPPLGEATPTQIAEAVRIGPYRHAALLRRARSRTGSSTRSSPTSTTRSTRTIRGGWPLGRLGPVPEGMVAWLLAGAVLVAVCLVIGRRLAR